MITDWMLKLADNIMAKTNGSKREMFMALRLQYKPIKGKFAE